MGTFVWILLVSYLIGSISFSYWITRFMKGFDIRRYGSGNAGATNMLRVVGKGPAAAVFILDALKGMAAVGLAAAVTDHPTLMMAAGVAAIIGHNWPVFLGFRGGKGIATTIGVTALLTLAAALISGVAAIFVILLTRYVSLGSLIFAAGLPLIIAFLDYPASYVYLSLVITLMAFIRHSTNIRRLLKGTESKLGSAGEQRS
ncbi:glycerol-3-phosphate acyltransferase 2 [Kroppenstedtia guangzhouensis]|jgi:acyl phosphate:glycerol-3-phosphate acyltransferase|uniref:Glycerol-3-phosphate acyltransferase n=1 Tax=Kroppenstedtia guangzhouensis TaxID=1274356 RepID=A0ABQ1G8L0_9BACL|nr:glycerol-3-phosphate 1-O-acyltransferase PlsY [Kroppenstedtia guangzhouensis]GGA38859.1 glycerol-3-phosphate acyltransferase 2 [Kroppenstedtia guangzhouensis]